MQPSEMTIKIYNPYISILVINRSGRVVWNFLLNKYSRYILEVYLNINLDRLKILEIMFLDHSNFLRDIPYPYRDYNLSSRAA
ncbi:Uncharacterised protein [uncultured archaeon]|nr:Uncharacterised protein [uncultured archaeon]